MSQIDWARVAAPQVDGYDTRVAFEVFQTTRYATKGRTPPSTAEKIWEDGRAVFVTMQDANQRPSSSLEDMPLTDPRVRRGIKLLDHWPEVRRQCAELLIGVSPLMLGKGEDGHGCTCGNYGDDFGWIFVSADSPWGFAEGIVHEMGHWKLRALGVWFEDWNDLLLANKFDELYASPVRKDKPRPMGAVIHAQYSYIHVARICTLLLAATPQPTVNDVDWTALQLKRITEGQLTIREHARGTEAGQQFLAGLDAWTTQVLEEGHRVVAGVS